MRLHRIIAALASLAVLAAPALAQSFPADATIVQNEVEVRSGPSKTFYPTSKLLRNAKVLILRESKEAPGWYEIKPPAGSFSWINGKYVKQVDARHAYVDSNPATPVPILPGSSLVNQEPNRESMKLTAGTVLVIVDRPMTINGETWLPIQPHQSEVRYIPAEAVKPAQTVTTTTPPSWTLAPGGGFMANSTLAEAEKAVKDNDLNRARQLFQQVANNSTDANQKVYAMNRLASLPASPFLPASGQKPNETRTALSPVNPAALGNLQTLRGPEWSAYGRLRDLKMTREDGQPIYALEDDKGKILTYVTIIPGKSLQSYLGRTISVYGPTMYRADSAVRMPYVVASYVAVP